MNNLSNRDKWLSEKEVKQAYAKCEHRWDRPSWDDYHITCKRCGLKYEPVCLEGSIYAPGAIVHGKHFW